VLRTIGVTPVSDERIVHEGKVVTAAGVSAGIDLGLWLAGQIAGPDKAKVIQLAIEYDPQPPFDSGHMSKASAATKASATALMGKEMATPTQVKAATALLWTSAIDTARRRLPAGPTTSGTVSRVINLEFDDRGDGDPVLFIAGAGCRPDVAPVPDPGVPAGRLPVHHLRQPRYRQDGERRGLHAVDHGRRHRLDHRAGGRRPGSRGRGVDGVASPRS
jgi:hypothetical protein